MLVKLEENIVRSKAKIEIGNQSWFSLPSYVFQIDIEQIVVPNIWRIVSWSIFNHQVVLNYFYLL